MLALCSLKSKHHEFEIRDSKPKLCNTLSYFPRNFNSLQLRHIPNILFYIMGGTFYNMYVS